MVNFEAEKRAMRVMDDMLETEEKQQMHALGYTYMDCNDSHNIPEQDAKFIEEVTCIINNKINNN